MPVGKGGGQQRESAKKRATSPGSYKKPVTKKVKKVAPKKPVREGQKLTAAEKAAYKKGTAELRKQAQAALRPKAPAKKPAKKSSDWDKGIDAEKAIAARNKQLQKVIRGR